MSENTKKKIDMIVHVLYIAVIAGLGFIAFKCIGYIFPFLIAMALVALLQPLVKVIHHKLKINQKIVSVVIMALLYTIAGGLVFWLITSIVFLLKDVLTALPDYYQNTVVPVLNELSTKLDELFSGMSALWTSEFDTIQNSLINGVQSLIISASEKGISLFTGFINTLPQFFVSLIFTILTSFFVSTQYDKVIGFIKDQLPEKAITFSKDLISILKSTVFKYIRAIIILMIITFVELTIGLLILRIPGAVGKAAGIALFDTLPIFGTGGIMIPWIVIELLRGNYAYATGLAILYGIVTLVRNIIEPKVIGDQLGINPIVSLVAIYIGFKLFGVIGMIMFPMLAQILLVLHQKGVLKLYSLKKDTACS